MLKRHRHTVHRQSGGFSCRVCDRRFYRRDHLKKHHISKHADEEYEAPAGYRFPVFQKSFHYRSHLGEHLKTHPPATSLPPTCPASPLAPPASGFRTDARTCPAELPASVPGDCRQCYRDNWSQIRSHQQGGKCVLVHTRRLQTGSDIAEMMRSIFRAYKNAFKINLAFDFILSNLETGEKRYYYPSQNGFIFDQPLVMATRRIQRECCSAWGRWIGSSRSDNRSPIASGASPCSPTWPSTCTLWRTDL